MIIRVQMRWTIDLQLSFFKKKCRDNRAFLVLGILGVATSWRRIPLVDCFQSYSRHLASTTSSTSSQSSRYEKANGEPAESSTVVEESESIPKRRRRKRNSDFPAFAYEAISFRPRTDRRTYNVKVCFDDQCAENANLQSEKARFDIQYTTSKEVNVSLRPTEKDSPFKTFIRTVFGPDFEDSLSNSERILPSVLQTRLLTDRAYARTEPFAAENVTVPPDLECLAARKREPFEGYWISVPVRILILSVSYFTFPYLTKFLDIIFTMPREQLDEIASTFAPGISILYGTFISLTLSILYNRQREIQDNVALECALLVDATRALLSILQDSQERAIDAGQAAADQIRTLVRSSRGAELMLLMYNDPYARMLEIVDNHEDDFFTFHGSTGRYTTRIAHIRDVIKDLYKIRSQRLSDESLALPPTHFLILNTLTWLILLGYTISILPTVDPGTGEPSNESSLLFGVLTTTYIIFYFFASDLNNPFRGVYQVRRSCAASHLLEAKWLLANHPLLRGEVDFVEASNDDGDDDGVVSFRSPGLGNCLFIRNNLNDDE